MDASAGEAASLFDAADSTTDLFAVAVDVGASDTTARPGSDEPTRVASSVASDLFDSTSDGTDFFGAAGVMSSSTDEYNRYASWDAPEQVAEFAGVPSSSQTVPHSWQQPQTNGYYGHYEQNISERTQSQAPAGYGVYSQPPSQSASYPQYAPTNAPASMSTANPTRSSTLSYDPYRPTTQNELPAYDYSQPAASTYTSYDPYKPTQTTAPHSDTGRSHTYVSGPSVSGTSNSFAPAPPPSLPASTPAAPPYRPKTSNAYDPPLAPLKQPRYAPARSSYTASPPAVQQPLVSEPPRSPPRKPPSRNVDRHVPVPSHRANSHIADEYMPVKGVSVSPERMNVHHGGSSYGPASTYSDPVTANGYHVNGVSSGQAAEQADWNNVVGAQARVMSPTLTTSPPLHVENRQQISFSPPLPTEQSWIGVEPDDARTPHVHPNSDFQTAPAFAASQSYVSSFRATSDVLNQPMNPYEPSGALERKPMSQDSTSATAFTAGQSTVSTYGHDSAYTLRNVSRSPKSRSPERTRSPGNTSIRSWSSTRRQSSELIYSNPPSTSPPKPATAVAHDIPNHVSPYEARAYNDGRAASPSSVSSRTGSLNGSHDPYGPSNQGRHRSMSSNSVLSSISAVLEDPYAPTLHLRQQPSESSSRGSVSGYYDRASVNGGYAAHSSAAYEGVGAGGQVLTVPPPTHGMYAPSPSLLGANDPLGRTSVRIPVISFGFGGKVVTCFHGSSAMHTGFDVALASRPSTDVKVYTLHKVIPDFALDTTAPSYPGPLFSDPGAPSTGLVRAGAATQTKTKKAHVIKYLEERAEEISRGLGYFHLGSLEGRRAEAKHILVRLLKVMVEHDGRLSGSATIDAAVRTALVPRLTSSSPETLKASASFAASSHNDLQSPQILSTPYLTLGASTQDPSDTPVATHTLRSSNLDKIQDFLLRGDRRAACHYASDEKLWAHAMIIASSIDKDIWKEVVTEFVRTELANRDGGRSLNSLVAGEQSRLSSNGREPLRVAYSLFAGQGPASVQELVPPKPPGQSTQTLQIPSTSISSVTPLSASFPTPAEPLNIPSEVLAKWAETAAIIFSSPLTLETSSALTALGDQLTANQWYEAAHSCYLLSPQTSPMGGIGSSNRIILLGSSSPSVSRVFAKDPDPIILSEIVEFAMSLTTPAKGQDAFVGLPYLQPYRFIRAVTLAEMGHVQLANRYCEAISSCLNRNSHFVNPTFVEQLKGLSDRLVAAPQNERSGSWIGSKVAKPSLDSIGNWLEGRLTKFIAGDADSPRPEEHAQMQQQQAISGPFAHYSTISSAASSAIPSPQQSKVDLTDLPNSPPPFRTGSAMAQRSSAAPQVQINRSSSAMDYVRPSFNRKASPIPRVSSASATQSSFADTSLYSQALNGHAFGSGSKQSLSELRPHEEIGDARSEQSNGRQVGAGWGTTDSEAPTPTASSFVHMGYNGLPAESSSGFISLMDEPAFSTTPTASQSNNVYGTRESAFVDDDEDDLGLGNSSRRAVGQEQETSAKEEKNEEPRPTQAPEKPELKSASSGSWISRLWKRESTPAPVKANLGEQTTFVYDKELKRWVNKNAGSESAQPAQPPPPPRAQTASPGRSHGALPSGTTPPPPPPARPATSNAMSAGPPPPKTIMRVRSNLVPAESENGSAPPTPMSATMPLNPGVGPPPAGSRSRAQGKRPVRNRYVDVFQQEQAKGS